MITGKYPNLRLRRNRKEFWSRRLIQENTLSPNDFILPIFLIDGSNKKSQYQQCQGYIDTQLIEYLKLWIEPLKLGYQW